MTLPFQNSDKTSWTVVEANIKNEFDQKVVFYLEKQVDKSSFVALDDLEVLDRKCSPVIDCDFDRGSTCSYSPYFSDQQKEKATANFGLIRAPSTDPQWPGPMYDVTQIYGGGYLFLTAFPRWVNGNNEGSPLLARIVSGARVVDGNKRYCLSLYTVLSSVDVELRLSLLRYGQPWLSNKSDQQVQLSVVTNITQSQWTRMSFSLDHSVLAGAEELQVLIEGRIAAHSNAILAIDEIVLVEGACRSTGELICENGLAISREQICNFVVDCPSGLDELNCGTCSFESNSGSSPTCGWANRTAYNGRWLLTTAASAQKSSQFAPQFDADGKTAGHYLLMSSTSTADDSIAEMALNYKNRGQYLKSAYRSCVMQFDYYIQLANSTSANIFVRVGEDATSWNTIYSIREGGVPAWRRAYAHIGFRYYNFMVDILGRLKPGNQGAVAVDNVQFVNCSFPKPIAKNGTCQANQFKCKTRGFCISQDLVCNFANDCGGDGEDELHCADYKNRCNFENSLATCGIVSSSETSDSSNLQWVITSAAQQSTENYFPKIDNTK